MNGESSRCFQTMESALEYLLLLEEAVIDAREELEGEVGSANGHGGPRVEALRLALYQMGRLSGHIRKSQGILSDLCLVRGLLQAAPPLDPPAPLEQHALEDSDHDFLSASRIAL